MTEQNKAVVRRLFDEVWNRGNLGVIPELYGTDFVAHYRPPTDFGEGLEGVRSSGACGPFPDYHEEVRLMIAEGEYVVVWFTITGTNEGNLGDSPPTGKRIEAEEIAIFRLRDGKVVEQRGIPERLLLLKQLGLLSTLTQERP
jgi:ketosteroid isomerase-like protein